ncbi:MAG: 4-hydroxy-tetrahydrodipicolinate reductase, partial [Lentisphaerae bacterium]|nr:4-hydroxy-tetrahydrodipicolinate reductase [Lentisphaerota bacterium]
MIRLAIIGAAGRMGQALIRCSKRLPEFTLTAAVESDQCPLLGQDAGLAAGIGSLGLSFTADVAAAFRSAQAVIDFSFPSATAQHAARAAQSGRPLVIGTTGLDAEQTAAVHTAATKVAIVWAPNMSLGVNLLFALAGLAAKTLAGYDVEIVETHHRHKKDAPSGTALRLAEVIASERRQDLDAVANYGRKGLTGERPKDQIGIHSVRAGDVVGDHTVVLA